MLSSRSSYLRSPLRCLPVPDVSLPLMAGQPIDLSDPDAWDDTALIRAYDEAVESYQVPRGPARS